ncbi:MAG TPA: response regulator [Vicinamibacterales bacterium]|nr:response regulator [Vicinamibacterales bacterium]
MARKCVLVVDDSPTDLQMLSAALKTGGYDVVTAADGEEAIAKATATHPPLVVLDIVLPKKNGFQVCRQLKTTADTKDIKVILVSSKNQDSDKFWGMKQGADDYIAKPYQDADLLAAVARQL